MIFRALGTKKIESDNWPLLTPPPPLSDKYHFFFEPLPNYYLVPKKPLRTWVIQNPRNMISLTYSYGILRPISSSDIIMVEKSHIL